MRRNQKHSPVYFAHERPVNFDVDDTLVMWDDKFHEPGPGKVAIVDPFDGTTVYLTPHEKHIQKLKGYARCGWFVVVWSAGLGPWAKAVVEALGLQEHVDLIMSKPLVCFDDLPLDEAIGVRKYYQPKKVKSEQD
jgi:hypothetical protein